MNVHISAAVLLIGVPVAKMTFLPLFFSNTACVFRYTPCDFLLYEGSTPFTPRCKAVAKPRCLYSCASSMSSASMPMSSKSSTSSVRRSSISCALTAAFCLETAFFFSLLAERFLDMPSDNAAISACRSANSFSARLVMGSLPLVSACRICSSTSIFSSILSCTNCI